MSYDAKEEARQVRILKENASSREIDQFTRTSPMQEKILRGLGVRVAPHHYLDAEKLISELREKRAATAHIPTDKQIAYAQSLDIATEGKTRQELSDLIDAVVKARESLPKTQPANRKPAKKTGLARHSTDSIVRALAARGMTAEQVASALETGNLMAANHALAANRLWLEKTMTTAGKVAKLTVEDFAALGVEV